MRAMRGRPVHQSVKGAMVVGGGARIAYDDHVVICIPTGIDSGRYAHFSGATGDDDGIDPASPQRQVQASLVKGAPTVFRDVVVLGPGIKLSWDLGATVSCHDVRLVSCNDTVGPGLETHGSIGDNGGGGRTIRSMITLGKKNRQMSFPSGFHEAYRIVHHWLYGWFDGALRGVPVAF